MGVDKKKLLHVALTLAGNGIPVFPTIDKKPCWDNETLGVKKGDGGYKVASTDPDRVRFLFNHPRAVEIAVPMGEMSGLLCIDVDLYRMADLADWVEQNKSWLSTTLCHTTRSGGRHYLFRHVPDVRWPATLRKGVDVKAGGNGFICWPGTEGYSILQDLPVADFPLEILKDVMRAKGGTGRVNGNGASDPDGELIERVLQADEIYPAIRALSYRLPSRQIDGQPCTEEQGVEIINALMLQSVAADSSHPRHADWVDRLAKVPDLISSAFRKNAPFDQDDIDALVGAAAGQKIFFQRPVGPQRETKTTDIRRRVEALETEPSDDEIAVVNAQDLTSKTLQPIDWLIPQMIPRKSTVSLAGTSNVGKTRWLAGLVAGLAVGNTARMGLPQCAGPVSTLWFANEERQDDIERRLKAVTRQHGDKKSANIFLRGKDKGMIRLVALNEIGTPEIDEENIAKIVRWAKRGNVGLIIFDPYVTLSDAIDENSAVSAAVLTKAFLLISELTGAAVLHAHHTPKGGSAAKRDWYRGDAGAWRGSGAIYSALDCGFTLSHWCPKVGTEIAKSWEANYLTAKLNRWIVLDTGKIREGEPLAPVLYEMVGQEMAPREGDAIGVCRVTTTSEAENCLMDSALEDLAAADLAGSICRTLGVGRWPLADAHASLRGVAGWPDVPTLRDARRDALYQQFKRPVGSQDGTVQITLNLRASTRARWSIVVRPLGEKADEDAADGE